MIATIRKREAGEYIYTVKTDSSIESFLTATIHGINISGKLQLVIIVT